MNKDKLIINALLQKQTELPFDFNAKLMRKIELEAIKSNQQKLFFSYMLAGFMSLILIAMAVYLVYDKIAISTDWSFFRALYVDFGSPIFIFSSFIAAIILFLLVIDTTLRSIRNKRINNQSTA